MYLKLSSIVQNVYFRNMVSLYPAQYIVQEMSCGGSMNMVCVDVNDGL